MIFSPVKSPDSWQKDDSQCSLPDGFAVDLSDDDVVGTGFFFAVVVFVHIDDATVEQQRRRRFVGDAFAGRGTSCRR